MNPFEIDLKNLRESVEIKDEKELLKLELAVALLKIIGKMETTQVLSQTGLDKADLSRLKTLNLSRFTIDRIVGILDDLGFTTKINVKPKKAS